MIQFQTPQKKNTVGKRASEQEKEQLCTKHLKEEALAMEPGRLRNELQIAFVFFYFCFCDWSSCALYPVRGARHAW